MIPTSNIPKFDKYRAAAVPSRGSFSTRPDLHPPLGGNLPLPTPFGEERIIEARRLRMARDSSQVLDPHAELNQYLHEPLVRTSCPVPIWWKVRATAQFNANPNSTPRRTTLQGSPLSQGLHWTTYQFRVLPLLQRGHS